MPPSSSLKAVLLRRAASTLSMVLVAAAAEWGLAPSFGRLTFTRAEAFVFALVLIATAVVAGGALRSAAALARGLSRPQLRLGQQERLFAFAWLAAGLAVLAAVGWGRWVEPRRLRVARVELASPKVASPLRLVVFSDLHSDARFELDDRVASEINALEPDVLILLGDTLNEESRLPSMRAALGAMHARVAKLAIRGNWDLWSWEKLDLFGGTGFEELRVGWRPLEVDGTRLQIGAHAWIDEWDPASVVGSPPSDGLGVLLYHANDYALEAMAAGVDLYLCGDTHGGQVALPGWGPLFAIGRQGRRFASGLHRVGEGSVFVTPGIGVEAAFPLRLGVPPEISVLELRPARASRESAVTAGRAAP